MTRLRDHHMPTYYHHMTTYYSQSSQPSMNCKRRTSPRATMDFISKLSQVKIQGNFQQKQQLQRMYLYLVVIEVFVISRNVSRQWRMSRKYNSYRRIQSAWSAWSWSEVRAKAFLKQCNECMSQNAWNSQLAHTSIVFTGIISVTGLSLSSN